MASVGEHSSRCIRDNPCSLNHRVQGSLPQITRIYTDVGAKDVEKICENPWHLWENIFSSCIRENPWNLWENIFSSCIRDNPCSLNHRERGSLPQITRIYTDVGANGVEKSTRMWVRRILKKSVRICFLC